MIGIKFKSLKYGEECEIIDSYSLLETDDDRFIILMKGKTFVEHIDDQVELCEQELYLDEETEVTQIKLPNNLIKWDYVQIF